MEKYSAGKGIMRFFNINARHPQISFGMIYTIAFFVTFLLAYSPFLLSDRSFVWIGDGRNQYYPALVYVGQYLQQLVTEILHGKIAIPLFDINLAMGGDVIATLNYYGFGNPLYLLSAFVPVEYTEYLYDFLVVLRLYLAGLAFSALCIYHKKQYSHALIGALVYAFSGYAIFFSTQHPFFVDPMIQLPLLLLGIDLVIKRKRPFVFILSVAYSALCGFYFLYMMTIMLGVYVLIRFFDCYLENRAREFFSMAGRIIGTYTLGIGLAAPIFIPAVIGFLTSSRNGQSVHRNYFSYGWNYYKANFFRLAAPVATADALALAAIVLFAVVLLFSRKNRKRRSLKLLVVICAIAYVLPLGGYIMNGFGYPSQRWIFGFTLLLSYILVEMLPDLLNLERKQQMICFAVFLAYACLVFFNERNRVLYYVIGVTMLAGSLLVLLMFGRGAGGTQRLAAAVCALLVMFNVSVNAVCRFAGSHGNEIGVHTEHGTEAGRLMTAIERKVSPYIYIYIYGDAMQGRIESTSFLSNVGAVWRTPTFYFYWSITNGFVSEFWTKVEGAGLMNALYRLRGSDQRGILSTLLSTKYYVERVSDGDLYVPYGYTAAEEISDEVVLYENQYALPWGYTYDSYISCEEAAGMNGLQREEAMLQSIILEGDIPGIERGNVSALSKDIPFQISEMIGLRWEDGMLYVEDNNATMVLECALPAKTEGYLRLRNFDMNGSGAEYFDLKVQSGDHIKYAMATSDLSNWYWGRENYLFDLGYCEDERRSCCVTFPRKGTYRLEDIQLFARPMDQYPQYVETLRADPLENIEFGTNRLTGTVELSKDKILCVSIPYSMGWTAKVDGERVDILRGNYAFMALPLAAGYHDVEFAYCSPGLRLGVALCLLSGAVVIYMVCRGKKQHGDNLRDLGPKKI